MAQRGGNSAGSRTAKDALFEALASVAKAIGSGRRAEILELLAQGERSVEDVAGATDQSIANASHHLRVLARAGLLTSRKQGTRVIYALADERVGELWAAIRDVAAQQVAEVERLAAAYLGERDGLQPMSRQELVRRMRRGEVVLWDVRPGLEYAAGHIPGARSVPLSQLEEALRSLPADAEVVAYCRGPFCAYADEAVSRVTALGVKARRLEAGFPEWRRAGLPVETEST
ncbi:MAG: ArsR/SmtB family transcription factor [Nitriliruptorales bacterium]